MNQSRTLLNVPSYEASRTSAPALERAEEKPAKKRSRKAKFSSGARSYQLGSQHPGEIETIVLDDSSDDGNGKIATAPVPRAHSSKRYNFDSDSDDDENDRIAQSSRGLQRRTANATKLRKSKSTHSLDSLGSADDEEPSNTRYLSGATAPLSSGAPESKFTGMQSPEMNSARIARDVESAPKRQKLNPHTGKRSILKSKTDVSRKELDALMKQQAMRQELERTNSSRKRKPSIKVVSAEAGNCPRKSSGGLQPAGGNTSSFDLSGDTRPRAAPQQCAAATEKTNSQPIMRKEQPNDSAHMRTPSSTIPSLSPNVDANTHNSAKPRTPLKKWSQHKLAPQSRSAPSMTPRTSKQTPLTNPPNEPEANLPFELPRNVASRRKATSYPDGSRIPLLNLADVSKDDCAVSDRQMFFEYRARRFDFPRDSHLKHFSPFASAAAAMDEVSSKDVCAVCGSGSIEFSCRRCPLAFHLECLYPLQKSGDPKPLFCKACKSVKGDDETPSYKQQGPLKSLPARVMGFYRLAADSSQGNPVDFVLHPSIHKMFVDQYKSDWLRCHRCKRIRYVNMRTLSEVVRVPFECADAFWAREEERSCTAELSVNEVSLGVQIERFIKLRSKRRVRMFYSGFSEKNRGLFGFHSLNEVVVLDEDEDSAPAAPIAPTPKPAPLNDADKELMRGVQSKTCIRQTAIVAKNHVLSSVNEASKDGVQRTGIEKGTASLHGRINVPIAQNEMTKSKAAPASCDVSGRRNTCDQIDVTKQPSPSVRVIANDRVEQQQATRGSTHRPVVAHRAQVSLNVNQQPTSRPATTDNLSNPSLLLGRALDSLKVQLQSRSEAASGQGEGKNICLALSAPPKTSLPQPDTYRATMPIGNHNITAHTASQSGAHSAVHQSSISRGCALVQPNTLTGSRSTVPPKPTGTGSTNSEVTRSTPPVLSAVGRPVKPEALRQNPSQAGHTNPKQFHPKLGTSVHHNTARGARTQAPITEMRESQLQHHLTGTQRRPLAPVAAEIPQPSTRNNTPVAQSALAPQQIPLNEYACRGQVSEAIKDSILCVIGDLGEIGSLEDVLVDLTMNGNAQLMQLFKALGKNPNRFARQAIRLAKSVSESGTAPPVRSTSVPGVRNTARAPQASHQTGAVINGSHSYSLGSATPPSPSDPNGLHQGQVRSITQEERAQLNEDFRRLRILQMNQCIQLEQVMLTDMQNCPNADLPRTHRRHAKAKLEMSQRHSNQIRGLVFKVHSLSVSRTRHL